MREASLRRVSAELRGGLDSKRSGHIKGVFQVFSKDLGDGVICREIRARSLQQAASL